MQKNKKGADLISIIQASGNVREACNRLNISKSQYYKLLNQPKTVEKKKYPPRKLDPNAVEKILNFALLFPFGCHSLSSKLSEEQLQVSAVSIQKLLQQHGLGNAEARFKALEQKIFLQKHYQLNSEQKEFIQQFNPALLDAERGFEKPGELIAIFSFFLGVMPLLGKVYVHFGLDACSGYVHSSVSYAPDKYISSTLLREIIMPFYLQKELEIKCIETSNDPEFFSYATHPFSSFLRTHPSIEHLLTSVGGPKTNGFCQRFHQYLSRYIVPEIKQHKADFTDLEQLDAEIQLQVNAYNHKLFPQSAGHFEAYPFFGKSPVEIVQSAMQLN